MLLQYVPDYPDAPAISLLLERQGDVLEQQYHCRTPRSAHQWSIWGKSWSSSTTGGPLDQLTAGASVRRPVAAVTLEDPLISLPLERLGDVLEQQYHWRTPVSTYRWSVRETSWSSSTTERPLDQLTAGASGKRPGAAVPQEDPWSSTTTGGPLEQ
jgi:hypothetical protein